MPARREERRVAAGSSAAGKPAGFGSRKLRQACVPKPQGGQRGAARKTVLPVPLGRLECRRWPCAATSNALAAAQGPCFLLSCTGMWPRLVAGVRLDRKGAHPELVEMPFEKPPEAVATALQQRLPRQRSAVGLPRHWWPDAWTSAPALAASRRRALRSRGSPRRCETPSSCRPCRGASLSCRLSRHRGPCLSCPSPGCGRAPVWSHCRPLTGAVLEDAASLQTTRRAVGPSRERLRTLRDPVG